MRKKKRWRKKTLGKKNKNKVVNVRKMKNKRCQEGTRNQGGQKEGNEGHKKREIYFCKCHLCAGNNKKWKREDQITLRWEVRECGVAGR